MAADKVSLREKSSSTELDDSSKSLHDLTAPSHSIGFAEAMEILDRYSMRSEYCLQQFDTPLTLSASEVATRDFRGSEFRGTTFQGDFSNSIFDTAQLYGCDLKTASIDGSRFVGSYDRPQVGYDQIGAGTIFPLEMRHVSFRRAWFNKKVDLSNRSLISCCLDDAHLKSVRLCKSVVSGSATRADFTRADCRGVDFQACDLSEAKFTRADLRGAKMPQNLMGVGLRGALIAGTDLSHCSLDGAELRPSGLDDHRGIRETAPLDFSLLPKNLSGAILVDVDLRGVDLRPCDLSGVHFQRCKFDHTTIWPTVMKGTRFYSCEGSTRQWAEVTFEDVSFVSMDFTKFTPPGVSFGSEFIGCEFSASDLSSSILVEPSFKDCRLDRTLLPNISSAVFERCSLEGADLTKIVSFKGWQMTDCSMKGATWVTADAPYSRQQEKGPSLIQKLSNTEKVTKSMITQLRHDVTLDYYFGELHQAEKEQTLASAVAELAEDGAIMELRYFRGSTPKHVHFIAIVKTSPDEALVLRIDNELMVQNLYIEDRLLIDLKNKSVKVLEALGIGNYQHNALSSMAQDIDGAITSNPNRGPKNRQRGNTITRVPLAASDSREVVYDGSDTASDYFPKIPAMLRGTTAKAVNAFVARGYRTRKEWFEAGGESVWKAATILTRGVFVGAMRGVKTVRYLGQKIDGLFD